MIDTRNQSALKGIAWAVTGIVLMAGVGLIVSLTAQWLWGLI